MCCQGFREGDGGAKRSACFQGWYRFSRWILLEVMLLGRLVCRPCVDVIGRILVLFLPVSRLLPVIDELDRQGSFQLSLVLAMLKP